MAWLVPENKLDAQQRLFLDSEAIFKQNVWIKGFAGSGKSILILYSVKKILARNPEAKLLLVVFTHSLIKMFTAAFEEMGLNVQVETYYAFMKSPSHYDYILCDEVQDLTERVIVALERHADRVIVAGDANQSIYLSDPQWREPTIDKNYLSSRDYQEQELTIIHRLPKSLIEVVNHFMPDMHIFSAKLDMTKPDVQVRVCKAERVEDEIRYLLDRAQKAIQGGYTVAVLLPTQDLMVLFVNWVLYCMGRQQWDPPQRNRWGKYDFFQLNRCLSNAGIPLQCIANGDGAFSSSIPQINVMTYHSSKGLDFDNVFIPFASEGVPIFSSDEELSRRLFMVAMTRTRSNLCITYTGTPYEELNSFQYLCTMVEIENPEAADTQQKGGNKWGI
ncbi:MAG: UvrD-helicase domain-containing protein [Porphyromonas sp.]|uniref:3'-5' exonuclease n=1 Tax=Porphyromonas sp. TaxID=1924944 RepID=UPI001CB4E7A1|nr:3'-5' exonuclease [Porphyromonas sp.]MBF1405678.1 UvrD-helicase domain-containing protein [Porphyromonas sp.]